MDDRCPKCNAPKVGEACPRCGLIFAKFDASALEEGASPEIKALWESVGADWENDALHAIFIEKALNAGAGGYAAYCYRRRGDDDPKAKEQLAKISKRLEQIMVMTSTPTAKQAPTGRLLGILILVIVFVGLAFFLLMFYSPGRI